MADFTKRIAIEVDLLTGKLKQGMTDFRTSVSQASGPVGKFQAGVSSLGATMRGLPLTAVAGGVAVVGTAVGKFAIDAANAAGDLEESMNKVDAVFGDAAPQVREFITNANEIGLSDRLAAEYVGTLGNVLDQLGVTSEESARLSVQTVRLAADFASFHNLEVDDVLDSMTAALRGEYDALQRVVPTINAAAVQTRALEMTSKTSASALSEQEKALAALDIMYTESGQALGDFERTSDSLANQQRILASDIDDLQVKIGQFFLPILQQSTSDIVDTVAAVEMFSEGVGAAIGFLDGLGKSALRSIPIIGDDLVDAFEKAGEAGKTLNEDTGLLEAAWQGFTNSLGTSIATLAEMAEDGGDSADAFAQTQGEAARAAADAWAAAEGDLTSGLAGIAQQEENVAARTRDVADAWAAAEGNLDSASEAMDEAAAEAAELRDEARQLADAMLELAGEHLSAQEAGDRWAQTLADLEEDLADAAEGADDVAEAERNQRQVLRDATESAVTKADAMRALAEQEAETEGTTLDVADAMAVWNGTMLQAAADAEGPLRDSIIDYIATANDIPEAKVTEIEAAVAAGDLATARQLLDEVSEDRDTTVTAEADTADAAAELDRLTKEREVRIRGIMTGTVPLEGGSLHLTDLETGQEEGVIPDEHTLELRFEADPSDVLAGWDAARQRIEDAEEAAREAEEEFTPAIDRLRANLDDLRTVFDLEGLTRDEYLAHLLQHLAGYEEWSLEWVAIRERIVAVEKESLAEQEAALREEQRLADEAQRERDKRQAEEERRQEERQAALGREGAEAIGDVDLEADLAPEQQFLQSLRRQARQAKQLRNLVHRLRRQGILPEGFLDELVDGGPEELAIAKWLVTRNKHQQRYIAGLLRQGAGIRGRQHGGTSPGGLTLVGEQGVELVDLPAGSRVTPAEQTERALARTRGGDTYHQTITINTRQTDEQTIRQLRRWTRRNGELRIA